MGAAFGGGDAANSVFGTSRNDVLVKITTTLATLFVLSCIGFSLSATKFSKPVIHAPVIEEPIEVSSQGE